MSVLLKDIAEKAGVSATTVSRYFSNSSYVSAEKASLIADAAKELGYDPDPHPIIKNIGGVISKKSGKAVKRIGILFNADFSEQPIYLKQMYSIISEASKRGFYALVEIVPINDDSLVIAVMKMIKQSVAGIIVSGFNETIMKESTAEILTNAKVPVVVLERTGHRRDINRVHIDNFEAAYLATQTLLEARHSRIAYIGIQSANEEDEARLLGFQRALDNYGLPQEHRTVIFTNGLECQEAISGMEEALSKDPALTGVVAWSDVYAAGILQYLHTIGRSVPDDISLVSIDDVEAPFLCPPVTSVSLPIDEMAKAAIDIVMYGTGEIVRTITLIPKIIHRDSIRPYTAENSQR